MQGRIATPEQPAKIIHDRRLINGPQGNDDLQRLLRYRDMGFCLLNPWHALDFVQDDRVQFSPGRKLHYCIHVASAPARVSHLHSWQSGYRIGNVTGSSHLGSYDYISFHSSNLNLGAVIRTMLRGACNVNCREQP